MEPALPENNLACTQCGGVLHPDEGQIFLNCPYCGAAVYLDKSQVVFHWYLASTLDEEGARAALRRWMAGSQTVKDLDQKARITACTFEYFPIWYFKQSLPGDREELVIEPAAATSISELHNLHLPAGDLRTYDSVVESQSRLPTVPLEAALGWAGERQLTAGVTTEKSLVHLPLYTFKYDFKGKTYTAVVEGGTGGVYANIYPPKAEAPFLLAGWLAALVFLCLATFPLIGSVINENNGMWTGLAICAGAGLIVSPLLFGLAAWVAAKI